MEKVLTKYEYDYLIEVFCLYHESILPMITKDEAEVALRVIEKLQLRIDNNLYKELKQKGKEVSKC